MKIIIIRRKTTTTSIHINDENDGNDETKKMINDLNRHALGQNDTTKKKIQHKPTAIATLRWNKYQNLIIKTT